MTIEVTKSVTSKWCSNVLWAHFHAHDYMRMRCGHKLRNLIS